MFKVGYRKKQILKENRVDITISMKKIAGFM